MLRLVIRPRAHHDVVDIALRIAANNLAAGERFFDAFESTCELLRTVPTVGAICTVTSQTLQGLRLKAITGFRNHLILYRQQLDQLEIIRVIHGVRDWDAVVGEI